jgi:hypothetical protein
VKNGVPYDKAMGMDWIETLAHCVVFGQLEGQKFDWSDLKFEAQDG